jgi:hypothetical protein
MLRTASVMIVLTLVLLPLIANGADVSGSLLYDDQPVSTVFPDITTAVVTAYPWEPGDAVEGTIDLATSTYSISGLAAVRYGIAIYLDRTPPSNDVGNAGDLQAYINIEPTDPQGSIEQDLDILYNYRVLSPIDSNAQLDGMGQDCTAHPAVAYPITFTIEPVPRTVDYTFTVALGSCPGGSIGRIEIDSLEPSAEIEWGTANEDYQQPWIRCFGASGKDLCGGPTFRYTDAAVWALLLRNREGSGRGIHRTDAVVIPAVAGTPGAQGTYWSSAVTVANLMGSERELLITYTPRGVDGLTTYSSETVLVPASSQLSWSDIVTELFSTTGAGALEFRGHQLAVTSRTSTPGAETGSYGQGIPPIQPDQILSAGGTDSAAMGGIEEGTTFRTNLGLCEVWGESATVRVSIMDASMTELGSRSYQLRPYENIQINQVVSAIASISSLSDGMVVVTVTAGNGRVGAYLSVVDNATGDPTFIAIAPQSPAGG